MTKGMQHENTKDGGRAPGRIQAAGMAGKRAGQVERHVANGQSERTGAPGQTPGPVQMGGAFQTDRCCFKAVAG